MALIGINGSRVLVLAPHVDDEVHCAGTINRLVRHGAEVTVAVFSRCDEALVDGFTPQDIQAEFLNSMSLLGVENFVMRNIPVRHFPRARQAIIEQMLEWKKQFRPDMLITPTSADTHQDHMTVYQESIRAFRGVGIHVGYIHALNQRQLDPALFVELSQEDMDAKMQSMECYRSQLVKDSKLTPAYLERLCFLWGHIARTQSDYAEAFEFIGGVI